MVAARDHDFLIRVWHYYIRIKPIKDNVRFCFGLLGNLAEDRLLHLDSFHGGLEFGRRVARSRRTFFVTFPCAFLLLSTRVLWVASL